MFVAIGGLLVLALTAALVGPYFVDWTSYRADFEREAERILGRQVSVRGDASARLLPFPSITFTDVVVAGISPGQPAMTVETFSMDAELAPFMQGNIHIFDMRLVRPSMAIDVAEDGAVDWAVRPSVPLGADHVSLEKLTITEGRAYIRHAASGRTHTLTEVNAELSARSLAGPWRMEGSLRLDGMLTALSVTTGAAEAEGMRIRLRAQPERYPLTLETDGSARVEDGRAQYSGTFRLNASAPGARPSDEKAPPAYRLSGDFDFDHAAITVDGFRMETGPLDDPYVAEGAAEFALGQQPNFFIRADGAQIRFDETVVAAEGGVTFDARLAAIRDALIDLPRPAIPGRIEVALPAVVAGDTTIRDVRLNAEPAGGGWKISSLGATLPGRATLEASGQLSVEDDLGFTGSLLLAVGQPSGFAAWLAHDVDDVIRRLPAAGFSAEVDLTQEQQVLENLELILGTAKFTGTMTSRTPANQKPSIKLQLEGEAVDLEGMSALASIFVNEDGATRHENRDLELELVAGPVSAGDIVAETVDTALRLKDGALEIDRLAISGLEGANVSATGSVKNVGGEPAGTVDATIIAPDLAPLVEAAAAQYPANWLLTRLADSTAGYSGLLEDSSIRVVGTTARAGAVLGLAVSASGDAGGTTFSLAGSASDVLGGLNNSPMKLELTARNDDATALYAIAGVPTLPLGLVGPGNVEFSFEGRLSSGVDAKLAFAGDAMSATFEGQAALTNGNLSTHGAARIEADDLEPWLATAGVSFPRFGYGLPVSATAEVDEQDGLIVISNLRGTFADTQVDGDINAQLDDAGVQLSGEVALSFLDLTLISEMLVGSDALQPDGSPWPSAAFATSASMPFTGELGLTVEQLSSAGWQANDARFLLNLRSDGASLSNFTAEAYGGQVSGNADFANNDGTGLMTGQIRVAGADTTALFGDTGLTGVVELATTFSASGKSIDGLVASLAGSGSMHLDGAAISNVAPDAFDGLLRAADERGREIDADTTKRIAEDHIRKGSFPVDEADVAFTIANGTLRAPPVRLKASGALLSVDAQADLRQRILTANALLTYDAGNNSLAGSEPAIRFSAIGPLENIQVSTDTDPLRQFFTQRALEKEQERTEAMQAALLERQRLRREVRYYSSLEEERVRAEQELEQTRNEAERLERMQRQFEKDAVQRRSSERTETAPLVPVEPWTIRDNQDDASRASAEESAEQPAESGSPRSLDEFVPVLPERAPREVSGEPSERENGAEFSFDAIQKVIEEAQ